MGHYESVCPKCFVVLANPAFDRTAEIIGRCQDDKCPYKAHYKADVVISKDGDVTKSKLISPKMLSEAIKRNSQYQWLKKTSRILRNDNIVELCIDAEEHMKDDELMTAVINVIEAVYQKRMVTLKEQLMEIGVDPDLTEDVDL